MKRPTKAERDARKLLEERWAEREAQQRRRERINVAYSTIESTDPMNEHLFVRDLAWVVRDLLDRVKRLENPE